MKFAVNAETLLDDVRAVSLAVNSKIVRALKNIRIRKEGAVLTLFGTCIDIEITRRHEHDIATEGNFDLLVEPRPLMNILKAAKKAGDIAIVMEVETDLLTIWANGLTGCRKGCRKFTLRTMGGEDFPEMCKFGESQTSISSVKLCQHFRRLRFAMGKEPQRFTYNGCFAGVDGGRLEFATTDSKRVSYIRTGVKCKSEDFGNVLLSETALATTQRLWKGKNEWLRLEFSAERFSIRDEHTLFSSQLLFGDFPDYHRIIKECDKSVSFQEAEMQIALEDVIDFVNPESRVVRFEVDGDRMRVSALNPDCGTAESFFPILEQAGDFPAMNFDLTFIHAVLKILKGDFIRLETTGAEMPGKFILDDEWTYVVMPISRGETEDGIKTIPVSEEGEEITEEDLAVYVEMMCGY